jgi:flagellar hook protein FlgE
MADNEWEVSAVEADGGTTVVNPTPLEFDANGNLINPVPPELNILTYTIAGATVENITLGIGNTTQLASDFSVEEGEVNGNAASKVKGYEIDDKGVVSIAYENGDLVPKFRVALASVQSPDNLNPVAGNMYTQSNDSGVVILGYAGSSGFGTILSGALEDSNVDVAEELTAMIESQRNYTANSKVFQTGSELMEVLVNLKR